MGAGGGVVLFLKENHSFKVQSTIGRGTNNYAKLLNLKLLLLFVVEKGCRKLHIFGDSLNVTNWFNEINICHMHALIKIHEENL